MAQSREQLTMDMAKSDNSIFKRQKGCYLSQSRAISLFGIFLIALVAVGVITHYATKGDLSDITQKASGAGDTHGLSSEGGTSVSQKVKDVRLPENLLPIYYKVELIPYVGPYEAKNFTIDGKVWIDIKCLKSTSKITIHSKNITIPDDKVKVYEIGEAETPITSAEEHKIKSFKTTKHEFDLKRDFYNVSLDGSLEEGKIYRMFIEFSALLDDSLGGFYRSKYTDLSTNETRYLGTTQFQATDARKAFPCFDEPALKAKFEVSLARRTNMSSIANMDLRVTEPVEGMDGWVWDHYNKSVPMSTYIVAFVVSDFQNRTSDRSLSTPVFRVWARKDAIEQAEYARDIGPRILSHYEKYFDIEFPLPKQDMIALPDFGAGAMENWGLITYRETAMLYDPKVSSDLNKVRAATVVAHELAHMWYGNLVTMKWWSDLWLNEGFASFVEYIGVDHVEPEWKILEQFVVDELQHVFSLDALDSSHAIYIPVGHPDEIGEIFDSISYSKGASIIRMMNHFLTESVFRAGLANYLKKWRFNSTVQDDLWESLTEVAQFNGTLKDGLTVKDIMDTWTLKKGFPVVKVERNYESGQAMFTQTKFQLVKNETAAKEYEEYKWWVPISYSSKTKNSDFQNTQPAFWLKGSEKTATHPVEVRKDDWIIVNSQETGFYRVNYDSRNWELIINQLKSNASEIHIINRAQLMDDALNLARAALLPYDVAFNVTNYLKEETEYLPWEAFLNNFHYIATMLSKSPSYGVYKTYMRELIRSEYVRLGYQEIENEPLLTRLHRVNVANLACTTDLKECIDAAKTLFSTWMKSESPNTENPIPTNLRKLTYCVGIKKGGEKEWDFLWKRYQEGNVATEKNTILQALSCSKETWILNRYLSWAITSGSGIRRQDTGTVIRSVAVNDVGNYIAFNFVRDKWTKIKKHLGEGLFSVGGILKSIGSRLNSPFELTEMEKFKARYANDLGSATRAVDQTIESIGINIQWMEDNYNLIATWLENAISARNAGESSTGNPEL